MKVLIKKRTKKVQAQENRLLPMGLEQMIDGLFPETFKDSFFDAVGEGYTHCGATKVAMAAHRGDI